MDAQDEKIRRERWVARVAAGVLAVVIAVGLWQMYGSWLMRTGEHGI